MAGFPKMTIMKTIITLLDDDLNFTLDRNYIQLADKFDSWYEGCWKCQGQRVRLC